MNGVVVVTLPATFEDAVMTQPFTKMAITWRGNVWETSVVTSGVADNGDPWIEVRLLSLHEIHD